MKVEIGNFCEECDRSTAQELNTASGEIECTDCHTLGVLATAEIVFILADGERV